MSRRQEIWREYERAWLRKRATSKGTTSMDTSVVKIAKAFAETGQAWLDEHQLTKMIFDHAQLDRRAGESPHQAFARHFSANDEQGLAFRKAVQVARVGSFHPFLR